MPVVSDAQVAAFCSLRAAGATVAEAAEVIELAGQVDQVVIDLAAWEHEARGKGGRWVRGNPTIHPALQSMAARPQTSMAEIGPGPNPAVAKSMGEHATKRQLAHAQAQTVEIATAAAREEARRHVDRLSREVKYNHEQFVAAEKAAADAQEKHKARLKFFGVMGSLIGGAVLAYVESKTGVADPIQIATAISPGAAEALFELNKRL
jgi:hypothetical protein